MKNNNHRNSSSGSPAWCRCLGAVLLALSVALAGCMASGDNPPRSGNASEGQGSSDSGPGSGGGGGGSGGDSDAGGGTDDDDPPDNAGNEPNVIKLSWTAPSSRENGAPISLSQIDSYALFYGDASGDYSDSIEITDDGTNKLELDFLEAGTYYVAMKVKDTDGLWSSHSEELQITIQ